jgi:hypothetical protein
MTKKEVNRKDSDWKASAYQLLPNEVQISSSTESKLVDCPATTTQSYVACAYQTIACPTIYTQGRLLPNLPFLLQAILKIFTWKH